MASNQVGDPGDPGDRKRKLPADFDDMLKILRDPKIRKGIPGIDDEDDGSDKDSDEEMSDGDDQDDSGSKDGDGDANTPANNDTSNTAEPRENDEKWSLEEELDKDPEFCERGQQGGGDNGESGTSEDTGVKMSDGEAQIDSTSDSNLLPQTQQANMSTNKAQAHFASNPPERKRRTWIPQMDGSADEDQKLDTAAEEVKKEWNEFLKSITGAHRSNNNDNGNGINQNIAVYAAPRIPFTNPEGATQGGYEDEDENMETPRPVYNRGNGLEGGSYFPQGHLANSQSQHLLSTGALENASQYNGASSPSYILSREDPNAGSTDASMQGTNEINRSDADASFNEDHMKGGQTTNNFHSASASDQGMSTTQGLRDGTGAPPPPPRPRPSSLVAWHRPSQQLTKFQPQDQPMGPVEPEQFPRRGSSPTEAHLDPSNPEEATTLNASGSDVPQSYSQGLDIMPNIQYGVSINWQPQVQPDHLNQSTLCGHDFRDEAPTSNIFYPAVPSPPARNQTAQQVKQLQSQTGRQGASGLFGSPPLGWMGPDEGGHHAGEQQGSGTQQTNNHPIGMEYGNNSVDESIQRTSRLPNPFSPDVYFDGYGQPYFRSDGDMRTDATSMSYHTYDHTETNQARMGQPRTDQGSNEESMYEQREQQLLALKDAEIERLREKNRQQQQEIENLRAQLQALGVSPLTNSHQTNSNLVQNAGFNEYVNNFQQQGNNFQQQGYNFPQQPGQAVNRLIGNSEYTARPATVATVQNEYEGAASRQDGFAINLDGGYEGGEGAADETDEQ